MSTWFPSLASVAWHTIKLIDDHMLNTIQKRDFAMFDHFDVWIRSRSGVDCFDKVSYRTTRSCYIELFTSFYIFLRPFHIAKDDSVVDMTRYIET